MDFGVPQGSILGSLFFLIYTKDILNVVTFSSSYSFVDDTKFIASFSDRLELQEDIDLSNKMVQKLEVVSELSEMWHSQFHSSHMLEAGQNLQINCYQDLGVLILSDFSRADHYKDVCKYAYGIFNMVRKLIHFHHITTKKLLYTNLVRSKLFYCCQRWHHHQIKYIEQLEKVLHRITKFILNYQSMSY